MTARSDPKRWQYLCDILQPQRLTSIVDIGANPVEPAPYEALVTAGLAQVYCFEPQESAYNALLAAPRPNQTVLPYAIGTGKKATLHVCRHSGFTSLLKPNPDAFAYLGRWQKHTEVIETVKVETKRLDDLPEIKNADLVKIDIQGGELSVFKNGRDTLGKASVVITEVAAVPLYQKQPLLHDQMKFLHDQGFMLHKFMFFKELSLMNGFSKFIFAKENHNQLCDGDAVFIKSLLQLRETADEDLKHLALLSDAVLESYDLTLSILAILLERGVLKSEESVLAYCRLLPNPRLRRIRESMSRLSPVTPSKSPQQTSRHKITAVLICYNNKAYIEQAVGSAISLTPKFEKIIVVDDCSTDGSYELLETLAAKDARITLLQNEVNSGPGPARNKGIAAIDTPYFCLLDGDDYFKEDAGQIFQNAVNKNPDADLFIFEGTAFDENGRMRRSGIVENGTYITTTEKTRPLTSTAFPWNKLYRTDVVVQNNIRFPPGRYEDVPWCYECIMTANVVVCIEQPIVWYRTHPESLIRSQSMVHFDVFDQWRRVFSLLETVPELEPSFIERVRVECFIRMTKYLFQKRLPIEARRAFAEQIDLFHAPTEHIASMAATHPQQNLALRRLRRLTHFLQRTRP